MNNSYLKKIIQGKFIIIPIDIVRKFNWVDKYLKLNWVDNSIIVEETNYNDVESQFTKKLSYHVTGYRLLIPSRFVKALNWKTLKLSVEEDAQKIIITKTKMMKGATKV